MVLDLMIHDIDLVQTMVHAPIATIDAVGTPVFSEEIDIANARIRFANGCVANATASRVSLKTERKLRIFEDDAYLSLDLQQKIMTLIRKRGPGDPPGPLPVTIEEQSLEPGDALKAEIDSFLQCIRSGTPAGGDGRGRAHGARDGDAHHRAGRPLARAAPHALAGRRATGPLPPSHAVRLCKRPGIIPRGRLPPEAWIVFPPLVTISNNYKTAAIAAAGESSWEKRPHGSTVSSST